MSGRGSSGLVTDVLFYLVACVTPVVVLFALWLRNPADPAATAVGNACAIGMLVLFALALLKKRR